MKLFRAQCWIALGVAFLSFLTKPCEGQIYAQHMNSPIGTNCNGFYDYLPLGFSPLGSQKYPLIIALHGKGEIGNGNTQLANLATTGIFYLITNNLFPTSFTVASGTYSFIVLEPQFLDTPHIADIDAVVNYALANYKVDLTRVYLTGYSMGGGAVWEYCGNTAARGNTFAAIVPVSGAFLNGPDYTAARVIASENLPVWATHNSGDPTVPVTYTETMVSDINQAPAPTPNALMSIFSANVHNAWTHTYDPTYIDPNTGSNMYQWLLQYQARSGTLPVVLSQYDAQLMPDQRVLVDWTTTEELNNQYFTVSRSADGVRFSPLGIVPALNLETGSKYAYTDDHPLAGANFYQLSQTDKDQKTTYFAIKKVVMETTENFQIKEYPNPTQSNITVQLNFPETGSFNLRICNTSGVTIQNTSFSKSRNYAEALLQVADIPHGVYSIEVSGATTRLHIQFLKQ